MDLSSTSGGGGGSSSGNVDNHHRAWNDRRDYRSGPPRGGGGGRFGSGGRNFRGGGGRGGRGRFHNNNSLRPYHGGGGGRGGRGGGGQPYNNNNQHHHRNNNNNFRRTNDGGGGGRHHQQQGNRFHVDGQQQSSSSRYDANQRALKTLLEMVNKVGDLTTIEPPPVDIADDNDNSVPIAAENEIATVTSQQRERPIVRTQAKNIQGLTDVVCSNSDLFLQYDPKSFIAERHVGSMVSNIIHSQSVWPLQTPTYATLTLSIHEYNKFSHHNKSLNDENNIDTATTDETTSTTTSSFAYRIVQYAVHMLAHDFDYLLLERSKNDGTSKNRIVASSLVQSPIEYKRAYTRIRMTLRYLCTLSRLNIIRTEKRDEDNSESDFVTAATNRESISLLELLEALVHAAIQIAINPSLVAEYKNTSLLLASLVWTTIPHLLQLGTSRAWIMEHLVTPLEDHLMETYRSPYLPGLGIHAILLKDEQIEDVGDDNQDEEDDDDDDDEEDDDDNGGASRQVCDSLLDLLRAVKYLLNDSGNSGTKPTLPPRFALFTDAPWNELKTPVTPPPTTATATEQETDQHLHQGTELSLEGEVTMNEETPLDGGETTNTNTTPAVPVVREPLIYSDQPLALPIFPLCKSLSFLLKGENSASNNETIESNQVNLAKIDLSGMVAYGRLPIFGQPPELVDDDDEDDTNNNVDEDGDGEEKQKATSLTNERYHAYKNTFGLIDRYFLSESIRDLLLCHESSVSEAGVERGSPKFVAEQIFSLSKLLQPVTVESNNYTTETTDSKGIEFVITESMLSLIVQYSRDSSSTFALGYLCRVLLELTRLQPTMMSSAIVIGISILFQDYFPGLVPRARSNISTWLAYHLTNTDYQWPAAYWKAWEPFVLFGWNNSRGSFVIGTLSSLVANLSQPSSLIRTCLPKESALVNHLIPKKIDYFATLDEVSTLQSLELDVRSRIWNMNEDEGTLLEYLIGDEISESVAGAIGGPTVNVPNNVKVWWRTLVLVRALLAPARKEHDRLLESIEKEMSKNDDDMEEGGDDNDNTTEDDVLTLLKDNLGRYKSVIVGVVAKDLTSIEDSSESLSFADILMLQQIESSTIYSRSILEACIQTLVTNKIVRIDNILKWLLADYLHIGKDGHNRVVVRWWEVALLSIQFGMYEIVTAAPDSTDMALDDTEDENLSENMKKARRIIDFLDPLLSYTYRRVCTLLNTYTSSVDTTKGSKLTSGQVDLVEGFKYLLCDVHSGFVSALHDSTISRTDLKRALAASTISGLGIASNTDVGGSDAVNILKQNIEQL